MDRKTLSMIGAGLAGLVFLLCLLPWFSASKEEMEDRGRDFSQATQDWVLADIAEQSKGKSGTELLEFMNKEYGDGVSYSGLSAGGLAAWLFAILAGAACALVILGKHALLKTTEKGVLLLGVGLFGIAALAAFIGILSTPTPKTFFAWLAFLACVGAGVLCFLATTRSPSPAPAPAATPEPPPTPAADAPTDAASDAEAEAEAD